MTRRSSSPHLDLEYTAFPKPICLTGGNFSQLSRSLKQLVTQQNRRITTITGFHAPAPNSQQQVGSWTGVLQVSDFRAYALTLPWLKEHWQTGRLQAVPQYDVMSAVDLFWSLRLWIPNWSHLGPQAHSLTNALLTTLTKQVVYGASGPRIICGLQLQQHVGATEILDSSRLDLCSGSCGSISGT